MHYGLLCTPKFLEVLGVKPFFIVLTKKGSTISRNISLRVFSVKIVQRSQLYCRLPLFKTPKILKRMYI